MWADTLLTIERGHLLRLALWAAASVVAGGLTLSVFRRGASFVRHFAIQLVVWGSAIGALVAVAYSRLTLRDFDSAMRWQDFLSLNVGLDAAYAAIGATLAAAGWMSGRKLSWTGAGVGVVVQGVALLVLDLRVLSLIDSAHIALLPVQAGWLAA